MKHRFNIIVVFIILLTFIIIQVVLAAPGVDNSPNNYYKVELFDLKKRGICDSTKYTTTNIDSHIIATEHHFTNIDGVEVFAFASNINPGETKTDDLSSMVSLSQNFVGDVLIMSTGEITATKLPFSPCGISVDGPSIGTINTSYTFKATVTPEEVLLPITITWTEWNSEKQDWPIIGIGYSVDLQWSKGGWKEIQVSAINTEGSVTGMFSFYVNAGEQQLFIPITMK